MAKKKTKKNGLFTGKPIFNRSRNGYIAFSGVKPVKNKKTGATYYEKGYYLMFYGSKTWRWLSLKTMSFFINNYCPHTDYGDF
jgi:hypothetical protein